MVKLNRKWLNAHLSCCLSLPCVTSLNMASSQMSYFIIWSFQVLNNCFSRKLIMFFHTDTFDTFDSILEKKIMIIFQNLWSSFWVLSLKLVYSWLNYHQMNIFILLAYFYTWIRHGLQLSCLNCSCWGINWNLLIHFSLGTGCTEVHKSTSSQSVASGNFSNCWIDLAAHILGVLQQPCVSTLQKMDPSVVN